MLLVRLGLWVLPFRVVHGMLARSLRQSKRGIPAERITWAVSAAARRIPRATCLTQALAGLLLLSRYGHAATLRLGVAKDPHGRLQAHAWLESEGRTILGDPRTDAFAPMPPLAFPR